MTEATFIDSNSEQWHDYSKECPGMQGLALGKPVPEGSIHLVWIPVGTVIPPYSHPSDEYSYLISGTLEIGGRVCNEGTFWSLPAHTQSESLKAVTDSKIISMRLGPPGGF